jgi:hypothetical protein
MKITLTNDWKNLFNNDAIGGRFSAFTFIMISFMKVGMQEIDGFTFVLLGLGFRITR